MLTNEENRSYQNSLVVGPIAFLSSSKWMYLIFYSIAYGCFDFKKFFFLKTRIYWILPLLSSLI